MCPTAIDSHETTFLAEALRAEAAAIARLADLVSGPQAERWRQAVDLLDACHGHVVVSGMGKSGLIGAKISATFTSLGQPSNVLHPAEAVHGDLGRVRRGDTVLLLSYSGETEEVVSLATLLAHDGVPRLGVSSSEKSSLARQCDVHLCLGDVMEACPLNLAPTASTTAMLAVGDALALAVSRRRNFSESDFRRHHPGGMLGVSLRRITDALRFRVGVNLPVVPDTLSVLEAMKRAESPSQARQEGSVGASGRRAGAVVLVDAAGRLSGIFTDGDLRRLMLSSSASMERPIRDVMTRSPRTLNVDDLVRDAERLVRERRVDEIPVVDHEGRPVGLIDVQDLVAMKVVAE